MLPSDIDPSVMQPSSVSGFSITTLIKRNGRLFLGVALLIWCWVAAYAVIGYHPKYASQAVVLIKDSAITSRYVVPDQSYALQTTTSSSSNPVLNTMGLLKSEAISAALYDYFKRKHPEELKRLKIKTQGQWEAFFADGKSLIKAKNEPGTDLISIQFTWGNAKIAKESMEVILDAFRNASLELNKEEQRNRSQYLNDQVGQIEKQLLSLREVKSEYKAKMGTVSLARESDDLARQGIELATKLNQVEAGIRGKEAEVRRFEKMLNMSPDSAVTASAIGLNPTSAKLHDQLYALTQTYSQMRTTLTEKNPKVREIKAQIEQVQADIETELARTLGKDAKSGKTPIVADSTRGNIIGKMVDAHAEAIRVRAEAEVIRNRMKEIDEQIHGFPALERELNNIEQEERSLSAALDTLRQRQLEAHMKEAETLSNVFIIDTPRVPFQAKFPNQLHILVLGFALGLAAGAAAVALKQAISSFGEAKPVSIRSVEAMAPASVAQSLQLVPEHAAPQVVSEPPPVIMPEPVVAEAAPIESASQCLDFLFADEETEEACRAEEERIAAELKTRLYKGLQEAREAKDIPLAQAVPVVRETVKGKKSKRSYSKSSFTPTASNHQPANGERVPVVLLRASRM